MYIKDPESNRMYALDSANGRRLAGKSEPEVKPSADPMLEAFNNNPYDLNKDGLLVLAHGLDLKLSTRMKEKTMITKIYAHIEQGGN